LDIYYAYFKSYRDVHGSTNIPKVVVEQRFVMKDALAQDLAGAAEEDREGHRHRRPEPHRSGVECSWTGFSGGAAR
jgi:hypothetical protein